MTTMAHKVLFMCNGSTMPQVCGSSTLPDLPFSEDEFIQAGLLPGASFELATLANPSDDCEEYYMAASSSRMPARQHDDTGAQQTLSQPVQEQPATLREQKSGHPERKQANKGHQKRFRERQKVTGLLDPTAVSRALYQCLQGRACLTSMLCCQHADKCLLQICPRHGQSCWNFSLNGPQRS